MAMAIGCAAGNLRAGVTDAISATAGAVGLAGYLFEGMRFDCGSKDGLLAATLFRAQNDPAYHETLARSGPMQTVANAA